MRVHVTLGVFVAAMLACPCLAQSLNIDFGDGNGSPAADYAGAGLAGEWNVLTGPVSVPTALVGLDGAPTGVTIEMTNTFGTLAGVPVQHPETGVHRPLMDDGMLGAHGPKIPVDVSLAGLTPGQYRVISYTWYTPVDNYAQTVFMDGTNLVQPVGGPWPGQPILAVTHMVHVVQTAGLIRFSVVGGGNGAFFNGDILINGIQLWKIDDTPPCPGDLDDSGSVGVVDLLQLLAEWGVCPGCRGDLDGNGVVDVNDFLQLLANWGDCPGSNPVNCQPEGGLGDCYTEHPTPGCNDSNCCGTICERDPYCCDVAWDAACVGLANVTPACAEAVHPNCGNPVAGSCLEGSILPGCDDPACCQTVCAFDNYCCNYAWDGICIQEAALFCSKIPAGCGHPAAQDCFDAIGIDQNVTPYCDDLACCEAVCETNPFCCDQLWDTICVATANAICKGGSCGPGAGSCFQAHAGGGCDDPDCCLQVCSFNPSCCDADEGGWTQSCANLAANLCVD